MTSRSTPCWRQSGHRGDRSRSSHLYETYMTTIEPIQTDRLILREFTMDDLPAVHQYGSDPEVMRGLLLLPNSEDRSREVVEDYVAYQAEEPRTRFELAITLAATGKLMGAVGIRIVWPRNREASMGYILRRDSWGNGYATEAAKEILRLGFDVLEAHRVFGTVDTENLGSIRVLEKLGMTREGMNRQNFWSPPHGSWRDTYYYAILEDEWRVGKT